jgi:putative membrane protein
MDQGSENMANSPDVAFLLKAAQSGAGAVQLGKLAREKAGNLAVKDLGNQMASQHGKIDEQLNSLAAQYHMVLPATMNAGDQGVYEKLKNQSAASFDKVYVKAMVRDHKSDIKIFKKEVKKGCNEQIKNFAAVTLPMLHQHLAGFQRLHASKKHSRPISAR